MAVMEGSLSKWTNVMKGWQYRWFVLDDNSGLLSYYTVSTGFPYILANLTQLDSGKFGGSSQHFVNNVMWV